METVMQTYVDDGSDHSAAVVVRYSYQIDRDADEGLPVQFEIESIRYGAEIWVRGQPESHGEWCNARGIGWPDTHVKEEILRIEFGRGE